MLAAREPRPQMQVAGLTGSLSTEEVRRGLTSRSEAFAGCFTTHGRGLPSLGGRVALAFHVARDGSVASVHPVDSTLGHREVERCLVGVAAQARFPRPHGGEADFTWPLEMDPPPGVREPLVWDPARVSAVVRRNASDVSEACGPCDATLQVTTWVSTRGRVLSAGVAASDVSAVDRLDCVAREVRRWRMPRSHGRQAKVTFELALR